MCRIVIQRALRASVSVGGEEVSRTGRGLMVLVGISKQDTKKDVEVAVKKMLSVQLFPREDQRAGGAAAGAEGRWELSVVEANAEIMLVSQFTLLATFKGRKPNFNGSMAPQPARELFDYFVELTRQMYQADRVQTGRFGELMEVSLTNWGPVTLIIDSSKKDAGGAANDNNDVEEKD